MNGLYYLVQSIIYIYVSVTFYVCLMSRMCHESHTLDQGLVGYIDKHRLIHVPGLHLRSLQKLDLYGITSSQINLVMIIRTLMDG